MDTTKILNEVNEIATDVYMLHFLKRDGCGRTCGDKNETCKANCEKLQQYRHTSNIRGIDKSSNPSSHANRLGSVSLNNQAVAKFLNITDKSSLYDILICHNQIEALLTSAIKTCPQNQVAHLNLSLFRWRTGAITDDHFQKLI